MTVYLMDGRALVEQQEQWTANRRFIFLFPSSRASCFVLVLRSARNIAFTRLGS